MDATLPTSPPDTLDSALSLLTEVLMSRTLSSDLPPELAEHADFTSLRETLIDFREYLQAVSIGDLSRPLARRGYFSGALKNLQASLRHLTWQTRMIAQGDFSQRVDFMGEFSEAFNQMVHQLEEARQEVQARTDALNAANRLLEESNRNIVNSIRYANMIQSILLPQRAELERAMAFALPLYRPRDIVGGDMLFFRPRPHGFVLAVIDCTGHGVPGALMTMTVNPVLESILAQDTTADPAVILGELNRQMRAVLHRDLEDRIDNGLDIGLCLVTEQRLSFAGARVDLLLANPHGAEVQLVRGDRMTLGYRRTSATYAFTRHDFAPAPATVYGMLTDGVLDQPGGVNGIPFGRARTQALFQEIASLPTNQREAHLLAQLHAYQGEYPQRDDITILAFTP